MKYFGLLIICALALTGCSKPAGNGNNSSYAEPSNSESALSMLHARPDPAVLSQVRSQPQQAAAPAVANNNGIILANLPTVSQTPFAPPANQVVHADIQQSHPDSSNNTTVWPFSAAPTDNHSDTAQVASYAPYNGGPSHSGGAYGSLVPPPPAVLSTQAQPVSFAAPIDVYGNPYANNSGYDAAPQRSAGSLFGMGANRTGVSRASTDDDKHIDFVPITPTGMDSRSTYKQRDDLKLLWKGALGASPLQEVSQKENRIAQQLNAITIGLPLEPSRGNLNVSQHQVDLLFKTPALDRRIVSEVKKLQLDVAQAYFRYLYAYNKYALAQQTVAARKQELDYAGGAAERQRAAADWSAAKTDADEATDDMKSAQYELASAAGAQSARVIIGRVSGVAPSADSLAQGADSASSATAITDKHPLLGSLFHFGGAESVSPTSTPPVTKKQVVSNKTKTNDSKADKGSKTAKHNKNTPAIHGPAVAKDLTPAPDSSAASDRSNSSKASSDADDNVPVHYSSSNAVAFTLKGVSVTPRKSIIRVAIRNNGNDNFTFDPDTVGVREGLNKLPDAMVRADFDTTKIAPNQEVSGTITIFGRPWNDRLSIFLADGSKSIQMRR
jgi:hypothetical protein